MAMPASKEANQPNTKLGFDGAVNNNAASAPANDNTFDQQAAANQIARERAYGRGQQLQRNTANLPSSKAANAGTNEDLYTDNNDTDEDSYLDFEYEDQSTATAQSQQATQRQQAAVIQAQAALQQQEAAIALAAQKQAQLRNLQQQNQKIDQESNQLINALKKFKNSKAKKYLSIFKPNIGLIIDNLIESLKRRAGNLSYRKKIMFLQVALIRIGLLLATLKSFRFISSFLDAFFSWIRWMLFTLGTIVIPIILFLLGFFIIPLASLIFYIGKIPLMQGSMTKEVIAMIAQTQQQKNLWQNELQKLKQLVSRQDQKKANQRAAQQIQRQT